MERPKTRADCINGPRPCPWISCKHHMLWVFAVSNFHYKPTQDSIIARWLDRYTDEEILDLLGGLQKTCTLDVADDGGVTLQECADILGTTRERIRQISDRGHGGGRNEGAVQKIAKKKRLVDMLAPFVERDVVARYQKEMIAPPRGFEGLAV